MARGRHIAYAVVVGDEPKIVLAEDETVLTRAIAVEIVASTDPADLGFSLDSIRRALLEEDWVEAVQLWMSATGEVIDAYPSERVWDASSLDEETTSMELRMRRIFGT